MKQIRANMTRSGWSFDWIDKNTSQGTLARQEILSKLTVRFCSLLAKQAANESGGSFLRYTIQTGRPLQSEIVLTNWEEFEFEFGDWFDDLMIDFNVDVHYG